MTVIKAAVFIISLMFLPVTGFLTVLYIMIDMMRSEQIRDEEGR